jgi:hypothetical protein
MLRQLPIERLPVQAKNACSGRFVAGDLMQRVHDVIAFDVSEPPASRMPRVRWLALEAVGKIL